PRRDTIDRVPGEPGHVPAGLVHGSGPTRVAIVADARTLRPAEKSDPFMARREQVPGRLGGAGGAVDIDPRVVTQAAPRATERGERNARLRQPRGSSVAVMGVGEDECVQ